MVDGCNFQRYTIMKRYIYTLLSVLLFFATGCDINKPGTDEPKPLVGFCFGPLNVETTDTTAVVDLLAYITVDGVKYEGAKVYVEYWAGGDSANMMSVEEYVAVEDSGRMTFTINDLKQNTRYYANVVCDGGKKYGVQRNEFTFATRETVIEGITCNAKVEAKGLVATINLSDVAYKLNDDAQQIAFLKLEYARKGTNQWTAVEVAGSSIKSGKVSITIPKSGDDYLEEACAYEYFVTLTPADSDLKPLSTETFSFNTKYADITADIPKPYLFYDDEGITIKAGDISVYYDNIASNNYTSHIYFRKSGSSVWDEYTPDANRSVLISADKLEENTTYEAKITIVAGAFSSVVESDVAKITTPKKETPILPEPPIGGDTSTIEGVWHLTSWRGAEPSFEVYMDITSTGGVTLYQRIESRYWDIYQSTAYIKDGVIFGVYTDGVAWGTTYNLTVAGDTMTWVSTIDSTDISVYTRSTLPTSMPTAPTRAMVTSERFL